MATRTFSIKNASDGVLSYLVMRKLRKDAAYFKDDDKCFLLLDTETGVQFVEFNPCKKWSQGGPLIQRYNISLNVDISGTTKDWYSYAPLGLNASTSMVCDDNPLRACMETLAIVLYENAPTVDLEDTELLTSVEDYEAASIIMAHEI